MKGDECGTTGVRKKTWHLRCCKSDTDNFVLARIVSDIVALPSYRIVLYSLSFHVHSCVLYVASTDLTYSLFRSFFLLNRTLLSVLPCVYLHTIFCKHRFDIFALSIFLPIESYSTQCPSMCISAYYVLLAPIWHIRSFDLSSYWIVLYSVSFHVYICILYFVSTDLTYSLFRSFFLSNRTLFSVLPFAYLHIICCKHRFDIFALSSYWIVLYSVSSHLHICILYVVSTILTYSLFRSFFLSDRTLFSVLPCAYLHIIFCEHHFDIFALLIFLPIESYSIQCPLMYISAYSFSTFALSSYSIRFVLTVLPWTLWVLDMFDIVIDIFALSSYPIVLYSLADLQWTNLCLHFLSIVIVTCARCLFSSYPVLFC